MSAFDPYDALLPIFHSSEFPRRLQQIGSAVFLHIDCEPFLLTVAHVTDALNAGDLLVPTEDGLAPIDGYMAYIDLPPQVTRSADYIDIAYYRLTTAFADSLSHKFTGLPQSRRLLVESAHDLTVCSASGYPVSKSKKVGTALSSEIFSFLGVVAEPGTYHRLGLSVICSSLVGSLPMKRNCLLILRIATARYGAMVGMARTGVTLQLTQCSTELR